ncbi:MAG: SEC-C metal-binding domain-containing protein [Phycisphaeraceae bacterium]
MSSQNLLTQDQATQGAATQVRGVEGALSAPVIYVMPAQVPAPRSEDALAAAGALVKDLWAALVSKEATVPWQKLETMADLVALAPESWTILAKAYVGSSNWDWDEWDSYEALYIPAIFAMAAPKLDGPTRGEIIGFLFEQMREADQRDDDAQMETIQSALLSMGPCVLPQALAFLSGLTDQDESLWFHAHGVLDVAISVQGADGRDDVIAYCRRRVDQVASGQLDPELGATVAQVLGGLRDIESKDRIQAAAKVAGPSQGLFDFTAKGYKAALAYLDGREQIFLRERRVQEWLPEDVESLAHAYRIRDAVEQSGCDDDLDGAVLPPYEPPVYEAPVPYVRESPKVGRNDPCPCGSGRKYKKCCLKPPI